MISNNLIVNCGRSVAASGRAICIQSTNGTTGADITIIGNTVHNTAGRNIATGVYVDSSVPPSMIIRVGKNYYNEEVTTPVQLSGPAITDRLIQTVSSLGTTAIGASADTVFVTANGAVNVTLPDASLVGAGKQIWIKNRVSQTGSTTVNTTSSQTIDGSATQSLTGAYAWLRIESDGANWALAGST